MHLLMNWPGLYWKRKCFLMHCSCNYILSMCEDVNQGLTTRCLRICFQLHLQKGLKTLKSSVFFLNLNDYIMIALHYIDRISPKSKMENNLVKVTPVVCLHTAVVFLLVEIKWDGEKKNPPKKLSLIFPPVVSHSQPEPLPSLSPLMDPARLLLLFSNHTDIIWAVVQRREVLSQKDTLFLCLFQFLVVSTRERDEVCPQQMFSRQLRV